MKYAVSMAIVAAALLSAPSFACPGGDTAGHEQGAASKKSADHKAGKTTTAEKKVESKKS